MASLKDFCIANSISIEKLNELVNKNGITYKDIFVIDESNINSKSFLADVNKQIKANQNIYLPKYMIFFHGTNLYLRENILKEGLLPTSNTRRRSYQSTNGYVYLAHKFDRAYTFGSLANGPDVCVFAVLVKTTDMCIDMDQLRNMACAHPEYCIKQTLADSIYYGGGIRFKGKIEPYNIVALN